MPPINGSIPASIEIKDGPIEPHIPPVAKKIPASGMCWLPLHVYHRLESFEERMGNGNCIDETEDVITWGRHFDLFMEPCWSLAIAQSIYFLNLTLITSSARWPLRHVSRQTVQTLRCMYRMNVFRTEEMQRYFHVALWTIPCQLCSFVFIAIGKSD